MLCTVSNIDTCGVCMDCCSVFNIYFKKMTICNMQGRAIYCRFVFRLDKRKLNREEIGNIFVSICNGLSRLSRLYSARGFICIKL